MPESSRNWHPKAVATQGSESEMADVATLERLFNYRTDSDGWVRRWVEYGARQGPRVVQSGSVHNLYMGLG